MAVHKLLECRMGFDQYHEPPEELSEATRTPIRVIQSMIEEGAHRSGAAS